jgi:hypothetical protein
MAARLYAWRWLIWAIYQLAWTVALLVPLAPSIHADTQNIFVDRKFLFAKIVHVSAYAVLAALTGWLRAPVHWRFLLMFFIMAHATVTEMLQDFTHLGRAGALIDVGLDHLGIALGTAATWSWWSAAHEPPG